MAAGLQSYEELQANLASYEEQQNQVEQLLLMDPDNAELRDMYDGLSEVIQLTEDLLKDAQKQHEAGAASSSHAAAAAAAAEASTAAAPGGSTLQQYQIATPTELNLPGNLPASVAEQIRRAQIRAALAGTAPAAWAVGAEVNALYSGDGQYYPATVQSVTADGKFAVLYEGYGNTEELPSSSLRVRGEADQGGYQGVAAPKRKRVEDEPVVDEIPKWLAIKEGDDEKTVARKKKLLKSYKSKMRFQEMDVQQKEKQSSWQSFMKGKGSKKKSGYFTGTKKESMFKVPDNGKVGVIGSGRGMTENAKRGRHEFSVD